jgi:hypothetical protein
LQREAEAFAVFLRRNAQQTLEHAAHGLRAAEAAFFGDEFNCLGGLFEPAPSRFDADLHDETRGRRADLLGEDARKIAGTHSRPGGHLFDCERFAQIVQQPGLQLAYWRAVGCLQRERGAELRLTARAAKKDDEGARHEQRQFRAPVFFDQRQRQINAGSHSRRGVDIPITNKDRIGIELDGGKTFGHSPAKMPVRRRAPPVEQAGGGQGERAHADRPDPPRRIRRLPQPWQETRDLLDLHHAVTARDKQRVEFATDAAKIGLRRKIYSAIAVNQSIRFGRDQFDLIGRLLCVEVRLTELVCFCEDRKRPGDVQNLGAWKGDYADATRGGPPQVFV